MKEKILDKFKYKNLALFGDNIGLPMMLKIIPSSIIKCAVAASIRPQYITNLRDLATKKEYLYLLNQNGIPKIIIFSIRSSKIVILI